jgi:hypothetical protein
MRAREGEIPADWDPLQAGYQAIIDICDEARSEIVACEFQKDIYDPERASIANLKIDAEMDTKHHNSPIGLPPPQRFNRRSRNPYPG